MAVSKRPGMVAAGRDGRAGLVGCVCRRKLDEVVVAERGAVQPAEPVSGTGEQTYLRRDRFEKKKWAVK